MDAEEEEDKEEGRVVFSSPRYVITKVYLNWAIDVKVMTKGNKET